LKQILDRHRALADAEELIPRESDQSDDDDTAGIITINASRIQSSTLDVPDLDTEPGSMTTQMDQLDPLTPDQEFIFRVSILQLTGLSKDYADVFCQFNFRHRHDEAFSTESIKNTAKSRSAGFYRDQNIVVRVTRSFREYLQTQPLIFELYGHYQQHPLHREAAAEVALFKGIGSNVTQIRFGRF